MSQEAYYSETLRGLNSGGRRDFRQLQVAVPKNLRKKKKKKEVVETDSEFDSLRLDESLEIDLKNMKRWDKQSRLVNWIHKTNQKY